MKPLAGAREGGEIGYPDIRNRRQNLRSDPRMLEARCDPTRNRVTTIACCLGRIPGKLHIL